MAGSQQNSDGNSVGAPRPAPLGERAGSEGRLMTAAPDTPVPDRPGNLMVAKLLKSARALWRPLRPEGKLSGEITDIDNHTAVSICAEA